MIVLPVGFHLVEGVGALLLEGGVADRQHLVDQEHVGVGLHHHREGEPDQHPRGVVLQFQVDEFLELGELDHRVEAAARVSFGVSPIITPLRTTFSRAVSSRLKPTPELDERGQPPGDPDRAGVGPVDAGEQLQQRALAGAVAADDAEELALADLEGDAVERLQLAVLARREGMHGPLFERVDPLGRDPEGLVQVLDLDRERRARARRGDRAGACDGVVDGHRECAAWGSGCFAAVSGQNATGMNTGPGRTTRSRVPSLRSGNGSANLRAMVQGELLLLFAIHILLTGLPGVAVALFAASRGERREPVLLAIALAATGCAAMLAFWAFYGGHELGQTVSFMIAFGSALVTAWLLYDGGIERDLLRRLAVPLALWVLGSCFLVFLGFAHGGTEEAVGMASKRFSGPLPSDNDIPHFFSDWFYAHGHHGTPPIFPGEWLASDRPPLQIGYANFERTFGWDNLGLHYQVMGVVLQQLWIVGLWALWSPAASAASPGPWR